MKVRKHFIIKGSVQEVGFRYRACHAAEYYGITGWVRNLYDGSMYGIGLMVLNDRTLWKVLCCIIGLLYAVIIQIIIHTGKEW